MGEIIEIKGVCVLASPFVVWAYYEEKHLAEEKLEELELLKGVKQ